MAGDTVRQIIINGNLIGILGLDSTFETLRAGDPRDDAERSAFLLRKVKERNYVPTVVEKAYAAALLEEYRVFLGELTERSDKGPLEVKVLGSGCVNCRTLYQRVMETAAEMNLAADIQYVTDMAAIAAYGIMASPALVIRDRVISAGRVLSRVEIRRLLESETGA